MKIVARFLVELWKAEKAVQKDKAETGTGQILLGVFSNSPIYVPVSFVRIFVCSQSGDDELKEGKKRNKHR